MAGGYIAPDGNVSSSSAARIPHGRDGNIFQIRGAVLAPVGDLAAPDFTSLDGFQHLLVEGRTQVRLQSGITADYLFGAVARHPGVGGIDVLNGSFAIGDHHGIGRLVDRAYQAGFVHFRAQIPGGVDAGLLDQIRLLAHSHEGSQGQGQRQERDGGDGGLLKRAMGG